MNFDCTIKKRSIKLFGHKTSVSIEDAFWDSLKEIAKIQNTSVSGILETLDSNYKNNKSNNLSSLIRIFVFQFYKEKANQTNL